MERQVERQPNFSVGFWIVTGAFLGSYFLARFLLETQLELPWRVMAALIPVVPFSLWLLAIVRGVRDSDELERRIHLEALAVAFPLTLILLMTLSLLELAIELSPDDWSYRHVWAFLPLFYLLGLVFARKRYA